MFEFREPPPSPFELRWTLVGIRFRIFPSFFVIYGLIIALLAWTLFQPPPAVLALAVALVLACVTVAIIFVSFVEGLVYRSYGLRSTVMVREFFSGVTPEVEPLSALQRIVVALSYPAACVLLAALVYYSNKEFEWSKTSVLAEVVYFILQMIALFWAVISLLPVIPYSGGQVMLEVFKLISPRNGLMMALAVSILVGVAYIAYSVLVYIGKLPNYLVWDKVPLASIFVAIFFAFSVMQNWQLLQYVRAQQRQASTYDEYADDTRTPWER